VKFVYKIHSGYDGFTPRRISDRLKPGKLLSLGGWNDRYLDVIEQGFEVWVYFHGPHSFEPGVYAKGFIQSTDPSKNTILLKVREHSTEAPLTDPPMSRRIAELVSRRYRQVFLLPEDWQAAPDCTIWNGAQSCAARECDRCPTWKALPLIKKNSFGRPHRIQDLDTRFRAYVPAYWVIPSRCYLYHYPRSIAPTIRRANDAWYKFKTGVKELAYPLALGMYEALRRDGLLLDYDCIVPIPLSPAKKGREIHRTLLLAQELGRLLGSEVSEALQLDKAISKRSLRTHAGYSAVHYEQAYYDTLKLATNSKPMGRVLLVDDVCTEGSTLRAAFRRLSQRYTDSEVVACTAGQMIVKSVVKKPEPLLA
jgi:predicted amidophosphoribosyltransferase